MKKLMTTLSAVGVALGLYAADTGTSFEGLGAGAYTITAPGGIGTGGEIVNPDGGTFWSNVTESATLTINNVGAINPTADKRSSKFNENSNVNFIDVKTTLGNPVYRKVNLDGSAQAMSGGVYFDSYVKFTAFEDAASLPALDGGKLAIWLMQDDPDNPSVTNLMITAGYLSGLTAVATNYLCHIDGDTYDTALNDGGWHRVTVKAVNSIYGEDPVPGFIVYIDGMVVRTGDIEGINSKGIVESSLTDAAAYLHKDRLGAIFPSVVQIGGDKQTITAVGFDGQGSVDDVLFTSDEPFPEVTEFFTIQAGENVVSFTYAVDGGSESDAISGKVVIPYTAGMKVTITPTYSAGCVDGTWTPAAIVSMSDHTVRPTADGQSVTVNGVFSRASVIYVEDNVVKTNYSATAAAAFDFINGRTAAAGSYSVELSDNASDGVLLTNENATVVLDLKGNNIIARPADGEDEGDAAAIYLTAGTLIVSNTTETIGHVIGSE
ncbi:MAG: hypothetical protein IKE23_11395, partial [Exiguobacterium sp.]|nr:hypothetical protein [Exiguobacterium sp.]